MPKLQLVEYYLIHMANHRRAIEVMRDPLWHHTNFELLYGHQFEIYGLGRHTNPELLENAPMFPIEEANQEKSIELLHEEIKDVIHENRDGIMVDAIIEATLQKVPATLTQYGELLVAKRELGEIDIVRRDKQTRAKNLKKSDLILPNRQTFFHF